MQRTITNGVFIEYLLFNNDEPTNTIAQSSQVFFLNPRTRLYKQSTQAPPQNINQNHHKHGHKPIHTAMLRAKPSEDMKEAAVLSMRPGWTPIVAETWQPKGTRPTAEHLQCEVLRRAKFSAKPSP